ncbi:hypothetical protein [Streptomyces natalensis]|uniref:Uncharacterized protein n=1 Tax=Streptomyces natalensis ATCC 27448 TaxID=1240678 RepID=A0A0D7CC94_9ACTN|nr:hypothetical protein [Streptomyces natalensis]KIZ13530.1 hypothetical protein SNA_39535 [Streptomyces natalensis ATCC 27448]
MPAQRRSMLRTAVVATGALAALALPAGAAFAADSTAPSTSRSEIMLPDNGLAGVAQRIGHLPKGTLIGGASALGVAGVGIAVVRRRHDEHGGQAGRRGTQRA